jgi:hypothetical protein
MSAPLFAFLVHRVHSKSDVVRALYTVFPLVYHSIVDEIPETHRPLITRLFQLWLVLSGTLIINMLACIFILTSGQSGGVSDLISSILCVMIHYAWPLTKVHAVTSRSSGFFRS